LRQITFGWYAYLGDNKQQFPKGANASHYFGGWSGIADAAASRPLNRYVSLPTEPKGPDVARLFRCPADQGDDDYGPSAYLYFGNSYQANLMLAGPVALVITSNLPEPIGELYQAINGHLKDLRADAVGDPSRLLLVGDNNWITQWEPRIPVAGRTWHRGKDRYNLAFFDGHVTAVNIHKGVYLAPEYRIQPFKELDSLTCEMQSRIVREVVGVP
jgi:prepilin-type processing-associated H-X9-DG protein